MRAWPPGSSLGPIMQAASVWPGPKFQTLQRRAGIQHESHHLYKQFRPCTILINSGDGENPPQIQIPIQAPKPTLQAGLSREISQACYVNSPAQSRGFSYSLTSSLCFIFASFPHIPQVPGAMQRWAHVMLCTQWVCIKAKGKKILNIGSPNLLQYLCKPDQALPQRETLSLRYWTANNPALLLWRERLSLSSKGVCYKHPGKDSLEKKCQVNASAQKMCRNTRDPWSAVSQLEPLTKLAMVLGGGVAPGRHQ